MTPNSRQYLLSTIDLRIKVIMKYSYSPRHLFWDRESSCFAPILSFRTLPYWYSGDTQLRVLFFDNYQ